MDNRVTLFEILARSQISRNLRDRNDGLHADIDRVTAIGFAPKLSSYLVRLKGGLDHSVYRETVLLISQRLLQLGKRKAWGGHGCSLARAARVARCSIEFYLLGEICKECGGRGRMPHSYVGPGDDEAGAVCPSCGGSGKASRNVYSRARAILQAGEIPTRLEAMLDAADGIVSRAQISATGVSRAKLA